MNSYAYKNGYMFRFSIHHNGRVWGDNLIITAFENDGAVNTELCRVAVPVRDAAGLAVRINKRSCSAAGGALGLYSFIADCIKNDFMLDWVYKIVRAFVPGVEI